MNPAISALLAIQQKDLQIAALNDKIHRLTTQRKKIEETLAAEAKSEEQARAKFNELRKLSHERSAEVDDLDVQIRKHQKQLDDGLVSFKEMEAMREQIAHKRERMEKAEEEGIALLEQVEVEAEKLKEREASYQHWKKRIEEELKEVEDELAQIRVKLSAEQTARAGLTTHADPINLSKYQLLLKTFENPMAAVRDGRCTGCSLPLSQTTLSRLREGYELVTCENCNRIVHL